MKKTITFLFVLSMLFGCSKQGNNAIGNGADEAFHYKDGEYTEKVEGYGGTFDLSVTIKNDKITNVAISENNETPSIGGVAAEKMKKNIMETQFATPDMVAGATVTCEGIALSLEAIRKRALNEEVGDAKNPPKSNTQSGT